VGANLDPARSFLEMEEISLPPITLELAAPPRLATTLIAPLELRPNTSTRLVARHTFEGNLGPSGCLMR
jgi:hypothetical protein